MIKAGFDPEVAHRTHIRMRKWASVERKSVQFTLNLDWFKQIGLIFLNDYLLVSSTPA